MYHWSIHPSLSLHFRSDEVSYSSWQWQKKKHDVTFIWNYFDFKKKRKYIWFDDASDEMKGTNTSTNISHALACFKSEFLSTPSKSRLACSFEKASPSIQLYVFHPQWNGFSSSKSRWRKTSLLFLDILGSLSNKNLEFPTWSFSDSLGFTFKAKFRNFQFHILRWLFVTGRRRVGWIASCLWKNGWFQSYLLTYLLPLMIFSWWGKTVWRNEVALRRKRWENPWNPVRACLPLFHLWELAHWCTTNPSSDSIVYCNSWCMWLFQGWVTSLAKSFHIAAILTFFHIAP